MSLINALTVDVEDWYQTNDFNFASSQWDRYEDRIVGSMMEMLELFDRYEAKGTFFVLGCVAEKHPDLVVEIAKRGHEIGSHGGWHRLITEMTLEQFREDVRYAKRILEEIIGRKVELFRAPSWSIVPSRYEALRILNEEGFVCDSSLQPFRTPLSGVSGTPHLPFHPVLNGEPLDMLEFPPCVMNIGGLKLPFSGGLYMRTLPYSLIKWALKQVNRTRPGMIYAHPWELDVGQPRIHASPLIRLAHYYHLETTKVKLERLLQDFSFAPLGSIIRGKDYPSVALHSA